MTLFYFYQPNYAAVIGIDYLLSELHNLNVHTNSYFIV
ncbi:hypothetical protein FHW88_000112 [Mucilaginibacter sp. SG538B]|nr:hypothetical protein [Mucilaginibacter sp. SG538B]